MSEKKDVSFEIYSDSEKMLEQIVDKYDLPDQSKALRCLLDYVEERKLIGTICLLLFDVIDVDRYYQAEFGPFKNSISSLVDSLPKILFL